MSTYIHRRPASPLARLTALGVAASFALPTLAGCGSSSPPPPTEAAPNSSLPRATGSTAPRQGMSTKKKVVLLIGAAALYYMWKRHQNAQGQTVQYYQSKANGRIYYRDPKTHQAIYVTPPAQGIQVPAEEAGDYSNYQGYDNRRTGEAFGGWNNGRLAPASGE